MRDAYCRTGRILALTGLLQGCGLATALAGDVSLIGVFPGKAAVLAIDGGNPKTVKIGQTWSGVTVREVERNRALIEFDGKRRTLNLGQHYRSEGAQGDARQSVTLAADTRGHFVTEGTVNGAGVRFLVDTGATMISLSAAEARRLGLDYQKGERRTAVTANGHAPAWHVKLNTVTLGAIELRNVDAIVLENSSDTALLGMSFLNRVEMKREGQNMTLIRRY
ncbi:MAG TPA: TIGR02281 family clan AA aspartic protease [Burkholderiales bacterium]